MVQTLYMGTQLCHTYRSCQLKMVVQAKNADGITFRMLQHLQEFSYEFVYRAGNKHANADGLSRMKEEEPEWEPGEKEQVTGQCLEPQEIEEGLQRVRESCAMVDAITVTIDDKNGEGVVTT